MAYFLGSEVETAITTEVSGASIKISNALGIYDLAAEEAATPTGGLGINDLRATNAAFPDDALVDITGIDLNLGALDEDIDYLGHRTPLKAEVHKLTTLSLTFKRKNVTFDILYGGDSDGNIARWGVKSTSALNDGLEEPSTTFGYRLYLKLQDGTDPAEYLTVPNCQMTSNTVTLNADGTQEQTVEFTSSVSPIMGDGVNVTATTDGGL
jgi:hypothetical protein